MNDTNKNFEEIFIKLCELKAMQLQAEHDIMEIKKKLNIDDRIERR